MRVQIMIPRELCRVGGRGSGGPYDALGMDLSIGYTFILSIIRVQ